MPATGLARRIIAWIACVAILMGSVAPAILHAMRAESGDPWSEICTASGAKLVRVGGDRAGKSGPAGMHVLQHCSCCTSHAVALGLPPAPQAMGFAPPLAFAVPELFLAAPHTPFAWVSAQPRAPPRAS